MARKNKKEKNIDLNDIKEMFDVKRNLKKLKKNSGYETYTDAIIGSGENDDIFESNLGNETAIQFSDNNTKSQTNNYELELGLERLKSELRENDRTLETKIGTDISHLKEKKLDTSLFWRIIGGLVTAALIISALIYNLSYSKLIDDVDKNKEKLPKLEESINSNSKDLERLNSVQTTEKKSSR